MSHLSPRFTGRAILAAVTASALPLLGAAPALAASVPPPAGGAEFKEVIVATLIGGGVFSAVVLIALAHRAERISWLRRLAGFAADKGRLPGWAALPSAILGGSLLAAAFGLYWDISLHLSDGRDPGPLANPSHYFILVGLLGAFTAGVFAMTLPRRATRPSPFSIRVSRDWHAPLGGVLIAVSAAFGLAGFPLDDLWHRMFGQDVTLWGPTHLLMLTGAAFTLVGQSILLTEGVQAMRLERGRESAAGAEARPRSVRPSPRLVTKARKAFACGALLAGLSIYQGEFDFGIPQFQMIFHPVMLMVAAGVTLTTARIWAGRGGALLALVPFLALRIGLLIVVDGAFDRPTPHFPLYIASALAVELTALAIARPRIKNPIAFGLAAGAAIGTFGLAGEWAWSYVGMVFPWPSNLLPEGVIAGFCAAVAAGAIGGWMGNALAIRPRATGTWRFAAPAGALLIAALVAVGLSESPRNDVTARVTTESVETGKPGRWITAELQLNTTEFDANTRWATTLAWQGPGFVVSDLVPSGPGRFKLAKPVPAFGSWKVVVRLHKGRTMIAMPLYQPRDDAIPAPETPALASFSRSFQGDREVLQRESKVKGDAFSILGYALMLAIALFLVGVMAWGIARVGAPQPSDQDNGTAAGLDASSPPADASVPIGQPHPAPGRAHPAA